MVSLSEVLWSPGMNGGEGWPWKSFMHSSSYGLYLSFIRWIFFLRVIKLKCLQSFQTNVCKSVGKRKYVIGFLKSVQVFVGLLGKVVHEDSLAIFCFFPPLQRSQGLQLLVVALSE